MATKGLSVGYDAEGLHLCEETIPNRFQFSGQQIDPVTQQYYLRARFTQEDTYRGDGLSLYAYCRNNPVCYVNPSGHSCKDLDGETPTVPEQKTLLLPAPEPMLVLPGPVGDSQLTSPEQKTPLLPAPKPMLALPGLVAETPTSAPRNQGGSGGGEGKSIVE